MGSVGDCVGHDAGGAGSAGTARDFSCNPFNAYAMAVGGRIIDCATADYGNCRSGGTMGSEKMDAIGGVLAPAN